MRLDTRTYQERCEELMYRLTHLKSQRIDMRDPFHYLERRFKNFDVEGMTITATDTFTNDTTQKAKLGTLAATNDGRIYQYCRVGGVAAVAGSIYQGTAPVAGNLNQTPAAAGIGATAVVISALTTTVTANQYAEGWVNVSVTPGRGIMYGIASHPAVTGGAAFTGTLYPDESIQVALTTSSRLGLIANPCADVIIVPTTPTGANVGVPQVAFVAGAASFGWFQCWGPASVLVNGTPANCTSVVNSGTTAGAVDVAAVAAEVNTRYVGRMLQVGVTTEMDAIFLMIRGR